MYILCQTFSISKDAVLDNYRLSDFSSVSSPASCILCNSAHEPMKALLCDKGVVVDKR